MKTFIVTITETLEREVEILANDENEAEEKINEAYQSGDIILRAEDCTGYELNVRKKETKKHANTLMGQFSVPSGIAVPSNIYDDKNTLSH